MTFIRLTEIILGEEGESQILINTDKINFVQESLNDSGTIIDIECSVIVVKESFDEVEALIRGFDK